MELEEFKQSKIRCDNRVRELEEQLSVLQKEFDEFKQSKIRCDGHIKGLEEQLLNKDAQIHSLMEALQQDNSDSCCGDDCFDNITLTGIHTPVEETNSELESLQNGGTQAQSPDLVDFSQRRCNTDVAQPSKVCTVVTV